MITRLLVAVDDSPAGIRSVRVGSELAARLGAELRLMTVFQDGRLTAALAQVSAEPSVSERRLGSVVSVLAHASRLAAEAGVTAETCQREGEPGREVLAEARAWSADLLVLGRAAQRRPGEPYVGDVAAHVLELSELPVLLVP
ncbi:MAG TPA: universal stress protein [Actinomycetes bacterium]